MYQRYILKKQGAHVNYNFFHFLIETKYIKKFHKIFQGINWYGKIKFYHNLIYLGALSFSRFLFVILFGGVQTLILATQIFSEYLEAISCSLVVQPTPAES